MRFVNVYGATKNDGVLLSMRKDLLARGFLPAQADIVPGPLLRSSAGPNVLTHMPFAPGSTYSLLGGLMDTAYLALNKADGSAKDPELDLQGLLVPKWGNHSWRRFCDKRAREDKNKTGSTEVDIDLYLGWNELIHHREMQLHYEGLQRGGRIKRANILRLV